MTTAPSSLLDIALAYAARGWHVFPAHTPTLTEELCSCTKRAACTDIGKHPRTKNGLNDATTDAATIRRWWTQWPAANIAIRTGGISGLAVIDRDDYKGGADTLADLERAYSPLPETVVGLTGGGGLHYVFAHPGTHVKTGVDTLGPGLDTRADGGYIIAPPSLHKSGKRYAWEVNHDPDDMPLAPMPDWVRTLCQDTTPRTSVDAGAPIPDHQRNDTLFRLGSSLRGRGFTDTVILAALTAMNATQCQPPLTDAEVQKIVGSVAKYEPGPSTPDLHARRNGQAPRPAPTSTLPYDYEHTAEGLWLIEYTKKGEKRTQLTNFTAQLLVDIEEDDGTTTPPRFFEVEATQGDLCRTIRLAAKDLQGMTWIADALGAKARVFPGKYYKEHAHAAIQDLSPDTERRHTYTHTGWREIEGAWCYLHGTGALTADGMRKDLSVALGAKFERYRLPLPPTGPEAQEALRASLDLRALGPDHVMTYPLSCAYLAPLRELLAPTPPDFVLWLTGRTGSYKSEYAALALAHFGDFARLTLPATFETTGNGLERLLHTPKDSLLVIDDYHPADSRREADAMAQVASRLLRGMGNMASRQRMRRDTTMQEELPPRCLALATGELVPNGHSNNARMFLVAVPPLTPEESHTHGTALTTAQDNRARYAQAMALYVQWIARHWRTLEKDLPVRYAALRLEATATGCHTREPGQVAYLQLAWETFTKCAVAHDALSEADRETILSTTKAKFLDAVEDHAAVLRRETTVQRFFDYLRDGLASKHVYLRTINGDIPDGADQWGWTPTTHWDGDAKAHVPTHDPKQAELLGYVDDTRVYLIPKTLEQYLHQSAHAEQRPWPVDMITLLRELDAIAAIRTKTNAKGHVERELQKKISGVNQRVIHLYRIALQPADIDDSAEEDDQHDVPF